MRVKKLPAGLSVDSAVAIYPGPESAFHAPFHFPATVDHRVVRLHSVVTFFIAFSTALFARRATTEWVVRCLDGWMETCGPYGRAVNLYPRVGRNKKLGGKGWLR